MSAVQIGEALACTVLYLIAAAGWRLIFYTDEPPRWWHPIACLFWPVAGLLGVAVSMSQYITFGGRK